jgi:hypothetical protein
MNSITNNNIDDFACCSEQLKMHFKDVMCSNARCDLVKPNAGYYSYSVGKICRKVFYCEQCHAVSKGKPEGQEPIFDTLHEEAEEMVVCTQCKCKYHLLCYPPCREKLCNLCRESDGSEREVATIPETAKSRFI